VALEARQYARPHERRLARPGRTDDRHQPWPALHAACVQPFDQPADVVVAPEVHGRVLALVDEQPGIRRARDAPCPTTPPPRPPTPAPSRSSPPSRSRSRSSCWMSGDTKRSPHGATTIGKIGLPSARAWVNSAKHHLLSCQCGVTTRTTACAAAMRSYSSLSQ